MAREHVIQTWVKHEEDDPRIIPDYLIDDADGYSGEQVGRRASRSHGNVKSWREMQGFLADGRANISGAADVEQDSKDELKARKNNPLLLVDPAFKVLTDYEHNVKAIERAFATGQITRESYTLALHVLDVKLDKAQQKLDKYREHVFSDDDAEPEEEEIASPPRLQDKVEPYKPTLKERAIAVSEWAENEGT